MIEGRGDRGHECRGDLVARERRGELSDADRIALDAHLAGCASCRMSCDIQADFAADSAVQVDDAERIARMSAAARRWSQRRARPPARWRRRPSRIKTRTLMLSMGALLIAGTASATMWWWRVTPQLSELRPEIHTPVPSARPRVFPRAHARAPEPVVEEPVAVEEPAPAPPAEAYRRPRPHTRSITLRVPTVRTPPETPASLLRLASEARARGDADVASSLYRRLQREFSDTREAALSSVPWGGILLRQGQAERALEQFDRYLKNQPRGNLLPEALYGRGRALAALGRTADEKQTWRRLLSETSGSAYDSHARRRLDELK